jgi:hypothetical protein
MSKFLTLVLVPLYSTEILPLVRQLLAPYVGDVATSEIDYWLIGGLYDGVLTGGPNRVETLDELSSGGGRLSGRRIPSTHNDEEWLANNQIAVADLPPVATWDVEAAAYAVVSPDGCWHDLWEFRANTPRRKEGYLQELLNRHCDCWAIAVMCHS